MGRRTVDATEPAGQAGEPAGNAPAARVSTFAALAVRDYRLYWIGLIAYVLGHRAEYVTSAWMVWELTHDPLYLGYLGLAQGVPLLLFQTFGGVMADRVNRLRLLIGTQVMTAIILTIAFGLTVTGRAQVEYLLVLAALSNVFRAFDEPTRHALVPSLVDRPRLTNAIALGSMPWQTGRMVGPSITGILIAAFGGAVGFGLAAAASYVALGLYSRVRVPTERRRSDSGHVLRDLLDGFSFVGHSFFFAALIGLALFNSLFGMSYATLLPIYADEYFHSGSIGFGLLNAGHGVGSIIGTLTLATLAHHIRRRGIVMLVTGACLGLELAVFSQSPAMGLALFMLLLVGFSNTFYLTQVNTMLQQKVPDQLRGRVMSIYALCWNLVPIGGLLGGLLAAAVDARFAVLVGGLMVAANALLLLGSKRMRAIT